MEDGDGDFSSQVSPVEVLERLKSELSAELIHEEMHAFENDICTHTRNELIRHKL